MNYKLAKQLKEAGFPQGKWCSHSRSKEDYIREFVGIMEFWTCKKCGRKEHWAKFGLGEDKMVYTPTLSELIEACGDDFGGLNKRNNNPACGAWKEEWHTWSESSEIHIFGKTPQVAITKLWLKLQHTTPINK